MAKAKIYVSVDGNKQMTDLLNGEEFDVSKKIEYYFSSFTASDGEVTLPVSQIIPITRVLTTSTGSLSINYYTDTGIHTTNMSGVCYQVLDPLTASNISGITIQTSNTDIGVDGYISILKTV